ncbi:hypothetical protein HGP28_01690 [Vibrio sp. SM6]|uniref:Transmembrane regulatory protein ToxS n=1 Tax=Vibrio agarilyticus TaxID=2726741 RepID=A0A7X8YFS8_9VIBR|nr:regulatory protein ToxS [Vibrio agarilyticus]NLS11602.1 hypothetical protein [Vibrio agarilyticus]
MKRRYLKQSIYVCFVLLSLTLSAWVYWVSDFKLKALLTESEWQSYSQSVIFDDQQVREMVGPLREVQVKTNVKYLRDGHYIRVSTLKLTPHNSTNDVVINISESGVWEVSDSYLLLSPREFKDLSASKLTDFSTEQLKLITQVFKMDAQQSRRIDIVNAKTLLLTTLDHGSTLLVRH